MKTSFQLLVIVLALIYSSLVGAGFKGVPMNSGVAKVAQESIGGALKLAGGGVILRGIASCNESISDSCDIDSISLGKTSTEQRLLTLEVSNSECTAAFQTQDWTLKDALELVESETETVHRNVNLLGDPTDEERTKFGGRWFYWYVELSESLVSSTAGEKLLTLDLLLTDPAYYAAPKGIQLQGDLSSAPQVQDFLDSWVYPGNWTWTDEDVDMEYYIDCDQQLVSFSGEPEFTFLAEAAGGVNVEDKDAASYYKTNKTKIKELNPKLFEESTQFSQVASFLRFLKSEHPKVLSDLSAEAKKSVVVPIGNTPRVIEK